MPVIYNNKKIIPAPRISISRDNQQTEDGTTRKGVFAINVTGKIVAFMGSPNSSGTFWDQSGYPPDENIVADSRLASIRSKIGALTQLFSVENKLFEVQPYDGTAPIKAVVRVRNISFQEGQWFDTVDYTIQLEADTVWFGAIEVNGNDILAPEENWSVESADDKGKTYRIQHTVSASGKAQFDVTGTLVLPGWKVARNKVLNAAPSFLGLDPDIYTSPSATNLTGMLGYNYVRGQQIDESQGRYSVTESWLMYNPALSGGIPCLEEYTINVRTGEDMRTRVSVEGQLTGLEVRNNTTHDLVTDKYTNALARWVDLKPTLFAICSANSEGATLNPDVLNSSLGKNSSAGTISFSAEYDNRPVVVSGAKSATVQVNQSQPSDIYASLVVLGKADGPVLQSIGTKTAKKKNIVIEVVMPAATMDNPSPTQPDTDAIVALHDPGGYLDRDDVNWVAESGRYSRNVAWTWV